jgi:alpha-glucosidase (family GH31 glycosyl hydrolase)
MFIHYLYTNFYAASVDGLPIMRPMWQEFPQDEAMFNVES